MEDRGRKTFLKPIGRRLNNIGSNAIRLSAEALFRNDANSSIMNGQQIDSIQEDDNLAPVMQAIDVVQQMMEQERKNRFDQERSNKSTDRPTSSIYLNDVPSERNAIEPAEKPRETSDEINFQSTKETEVKETSSDRLTAIDATIMKDKVREMSVNSSGLQDDEDDLPVVRTNPFIKFRNPVPNEKRQDEYEFIPKSVILDVYSNDPEVKRFLKQLPRIGNEFGFNEQDYKCYSCRRPIGMVFGQSRLCHYDGHHYCSECHLGEKSVIPARILCNWDFNKYPISKRNQHFLTLISNEPMFKLKTMAPLLYKTCPDLIEIEELRCQAFFIRSYCFTCVQDTISFELTKLVWPREHLIKQTDLYSLDDFNQIKSGALKLVLKSVITFGRQHVLSCVLCCQKGFICEVCKSSQIIYPFDTESVHRCDSCQSIYHRSCFKSSHEACPRCQRLEARRSDDLERADR